MSTSCTSNTQSVACVANQKHYISGGKYQKNYAGKFNSTWYINSDMPDKARYAEYEGGNLYNNGQLHDSTGGHTAAYNTTYYYYEGNKYEVAMYIIMAPILVEHFEIVIIKNQCIIGITALKQML